MASSILNSNLSLFHASRTWQTNEVTEAVRGSTRQTDEVTEAVRGSTRQTDEVIEVPIQSVRVSTQVGSKKLKPFKYQMAKADVVKSGVYGLKSGAVGSIVFPA